MSFPKFPEFRRFSINDKEEYLQYYAQLDAPYSDLSIDDVYIWLDYNHDLDVSELHGNVVFRCTSIIDRNAYYYILIGISNLQKTIDDIQQITSMLSYTPKHTANLISQLQQPNVSIIEDTDNTDYVYSVDDLLALTGKPYKNLRKRLNLFERTYPRTEIRKFDLENTSDIDIIASSIHNWFRQEEASHNDPENRESHAITTHLQLATWLPVQAYGLYIDGKLANINIFHTPPHKDWLIFNHMKCDYSYRDISRFAYYSVFRIAQSQGIKWINAEQDLGIDGLRQIKQYFRPAYRLERYTILLDSKQDTNNPT